MNGLQKKRHKSNNDPDTSYRDDLAQLGKEFLTDHKDTIPDDPVAWVEQTRILRGQKFSLDGREYMRQIYRDQAQQVMIRKGRQTECSEMLVNLMMYNAVKFPGTISLYLSKDWKSTRVFSKLRLESMAMQTSPDWEKQFTDKDDQIMTEKKLQNGSMIYLRSAFNAFEEARSFPLDFAYLDESQSVSMDKLDVLIESMAHSDHKRLWAVGTGAPSETAWHARYSLGIAHKWHKGRGVWVPEPGKTDMQGIQHCYHIPQSITSYITQDEVKRKIDKSPSRTTALQEIEGEFTDGSQVPITQAAMQTCFKERLPRHTDQSLLVGMDWGGGSRSKTVLWAMWHDADMDAFIVHDVKIIEQKSPALQAQAAIKYIERMDPGAICIDEGGGMHQVDTLTSTYPDRVTKAHFLTDIAKPFEHVPDMNRVNIDRTTAIDGIIDLIDTGRLKIPRKFDWIIPHFTCIRGQVIALTGGQNYLRYGKDRTSQNDALMACVYAHAAHKLKGLKPKFFCGIF